MHSLLFILQEGKVSARIPALESASHDIRLPPPNFRREERTVVPYGGLSSKSGWVGSFPARTVGNLMVITLAGETSVRNTVLCQSEILVEEF